MPAHPPEQYDLAADEAFRRVVIRGSVLATPEFNHAVHPEIFGLEPDREYFCRFRVGSHLSMVGRTKTTSKPSTTPRELSFVFASCNAWQSGFCTAYEHMANEDLDPVVHLGDYLYESGVQNNSRGIETDERFHTETTTLPRIACSIHRPRATRSCSLRTPVSRGFTRSTTTKSSTTGPATFRKIPRRSKDSGHGGRRRSAMYENMPLRHAQMPAGPDVRLHRRLPYGTLADFTMLDTRQYRSDQPCGDDRSTDCVERFDPDRTMLGGKQKAWLFAGFSQSPARWHIWATRCRCCIPTMIRAPRSPTFGSTPGMVTSLSEQMLAEVHDRGVRNLVVITGDRPTNYAADLKRTMPTRTR